MAEGTGVSGLGPTGADGPHCFVEDLEVPVLDAGDRHHLQKVLRLRDGDPLTVSDGAGRWRPCRFGATVAPAGAIDTIPAPAPRLTVGFALVKGDKPELAVQKLTEAGVDVIAPFVAARSVVRWDADKATRQHERLTRIAREAAMQCRRVHLPVVAPVCDLATLVARPGGAAVRADIGGRPLTSADHTVLVGPEGGWTDDERRTVPHAVGLGPTVLRAETAAIAAGILLVALRDGYVGEISRRAGHSDQYH